MTITVRVPFIEKNLIKLNKLLAIAVHTMTIKPSAETRTNGPIVCLTLFHKGRPFRYPNFPNTIHSIP